MTQPIEAFLDAIEARVNRLREVREKATEGEWVQERVDHDRSITFEIGPKVDGSYGFRFVLREENYEVERDNGEFSHNIARLKGDAEFIVSAANETPELTREVARLVEAVRVLSEALEKCNKHCDNYSCVSVTDDARARVEKLLEER